MELWRRIKLNNQINENEFMSQISKAILIHNDQGQHAGAS